MSKKVKSLLLVLCALVFAVAGIFATLAYLQDETQEIDNTMTVGDVNITLDESEVTYDEYYQTPTIGARREIGNEYNLIPGVTYVKDPEVHVEAGSEPAYVFVRIINEIADIEDSTNLVANQMKDLGWVEALKANIDGLSQDYPGLYVYNKDGVVDKAYIVNAKEATDDIDLRVFDDFTIRSDINNDINSVPNLADYDGKSIKIKAFAIQAVGVNIDSAASQADAAFAAPDVVNP